MALFQIDVPTDVVWSQQTTTLAGAPYRLEFRYNPRDTLWRMSISDGSNIPILLGIPLVTSRDLTLQYPQLALPSGIFFIVDGTGQNSDPSLDSFASTHALYFLDAEA